MKLYISDYICEERTVISLKLIRNEYLRECPDKESEQKRALELDLAGLTNTKELNSIRTSLTLQGLPATF